MKITDEYVTEKIEAYNIAISALESHEPGSDCSSALAKKMRSDLAKRLNSEINRWCSKYITWNK